MAEISRVPKSWSISEKSSNGLNFLYFFHRFGFEVGQSLKKRISHLIILKVAAVNRRELREYILSDHVEAQNHSFTVERLSLYDFTFSVYFNGFVENRTVFILIVQWLLQSGHNRPVAVEDYPMFNTPSQATSFRRTSSHSLDTDETLRLATQKLTQAPQSHQQPEQQHQTAPAVSHAYVIPISIPSLENFQQQPSQQHRASVEQNNAGPVCPAEVAQIGSSNGVSTIAGTRF